MSELVGFLLIFVAVGVFFVFFHLVMGSLIRPRTPKAEDPEKFTIYECGEPTIGSAWIQFDLRFYVIALLFVIFDVEVAFFFPWAVVFGKTNAIANPEVTVEERARAYLDLAPAGDAKAQRLQALLEQQKTSSDPAVRDRINDELSAVNAGARRLGWIAFLDILVFFGVLLVGFAYLWKRGDLHWVRSLAAEPTAAIPAKTPALVGAASQAEGY